MNVQRRIIGLRDTAQQLSLAGGCVWHAESGVRGSAIAVAPASAQTIQSAADEPISVSHGDHLRERYDFHRPLHEWAFKGFMKHFLCTRGQLSDVMCEPWRTFGFPFVATDTGLGQATPEQERRLGGIGHSFIYGDPTAMMQLARLIALPAVRYLSQTFDHGWTRDNSFGDPAVALGDWVYIIYEVGLRTADPALRRYYRFVMPFTAADCPAVSDDMLVGFDDGTGIVRSAFRRPRLWKLFWQAALRRELAFSRLGTDLVLASRTALDHLVDADLADAVGSAFDEHIIPATIAEAGPEYALEWTGDYWHLTFEGNTTHVKDGVGPRYIALLLDNRGKELFCADMIALANGNPVIKISQSKDLLADGAAIQEYERHIRELTEELEEAKEFNDWGRQEKLQYKLDALEEDVLKLRGLHGKSRTFSGTFDNARTSVTNAINRTLNSDAVQKQLPEAYRHLDKAISRGMFMLYDPEKPIDWAVSGGEI